LSPGSNTFPRSPTSISSKGSPVPGSNSKLPAVVVVPVGVSVVVPVDVGVAAVVVPAESLGAPIHPATRAAPSVPAADSRDRRRIPSRRAAHFKPVRETQTVL